MDEIDYKILEILEKDSRTPFTEIAKKLKISESAVRKRIRKMLKDKIIKFTIESKVLRKLKAIMLINVTPSIPTTKVSQKIEKIEGVSATYEVSGIYDIVVILSAENVESLNNSIEEIRRIKGITQTITFLVLK